MRVTRVETISLKRGITVHAGPIQWLWVRVHTDAGIVGLGETYPHPGAESAVVLDRLAPVLLGQDALAIEKLWAEMFLAVSYSGWAGAECRAISAVDMALWDLAGKAAGLPVYRLLGGPCREQIRVYNTCYDHIDFHADPVRLARSLLESGISAMKIWPFDRVAGETGGHSISAAQMRQGLEPLRLIREELGDSMEVAMEFHGLWDLACAIEIARACEPYSPLWLEEMLPQDNLAAYERLAQVTRAPLTISERLMTHWQYRELAENGAARVFMPDLSWCGGLTAARKIAALAETYYLPVAPHNCGGPVLHVASAHFAAAIPNLKILETVRRHYGEEYAGLTNGQLSPVQGWLPLPPGPGLGVELRPEVLARDDLTVGSREG